MSGSNSLRALLAALKPKVQAAKAMVDRGAPTLAVGPLTLSLAGVAARLRAAGPSITAATLTAVITGGASVRDYDLLAVPTGATPQAAAAASEPVVGLTAGPVTLDLSGPLGHAALLDVELTVTLTVNGVSQSRTLNRALALTVPALAQGCSL